jgi:hypothetical protein
MPLKVEVTLQLTVSQTVCQGIEPTLGLAARLFIWRDLFRYVLPMRLSF